MTKLGKFVAAWIALVCGLGANGAATGRFTNLLVRTRYRLERFNPRTGERASLGDQLSDASGTLVLPARPDREDWVFSAAAAGEDDLQAKEVQR